MSALRKQLPGLSYCPVLTMLGTDAFCAIRVLLHRCARLKQERESLSCSLRILFQARRILVFGESKGILAAPPVLSTVGKFGKW